MAKRKKKVFTEKKVTSDIVRGKFALEREADERPVIVNGGVPGDIVDVVVVKKKKGYMEAAITEFHHESDLRKTAFCEHFGVCGGCKWQNISYERQLSFKQQQVEQAFLSKQIDTEVLPILGCEKTQYYRNKLEFTFSDRCWDIFTKGIGFHVAGRFDKIVDVDHCYLQPAPSNEIRLALREFAIENDISCYDTRNHCGFLRNVVIRTSELQQVMVIVIFSQEEEEKRTAILEHLVEKFPDITSLMYIINEKLNDSYSDLPVHLFYGQDHIYEKIGDLRFKISANSFFQTNSLQCEKLYRTVLEFASFRGTENIYDLYTGAGTIANFVAHCVASVVGIEYIPEAIENAKENSQINNITNTKFFAGDVVKLLTSEFIQQHNKPDIIITDPPRSGMHPKVVETLNHLKCPKIVYVSCNPVTQTHDIQLLDNYSVTKVRPVDMFPQTPHIESVALLELR